MKQLLPLERLERVEAWGMATDAMSYVYRPSTVDRLESILDFASQRGVSVAMRGGGRSYGDAALNAEQVLVDTSRMCRILDWDPDRGLISVEPGVTIGQLWRYVLGDGWWPKVVPGTMYPTIGGCLAMNIHGKNNWKAGTFGEHVREFQALLADGRVVRCTPSRNSELFHSMIGGLGYLGIFTRITLELKRVHSGSMKVRSLTAPTIEDLVERVDRLKDSSDYVVGWVDCLARGSALGRGQIHTADYLEPGEDPAPEQTLRLDNQDLPDSFFGLIPKSMMWLLMRPLMNDVGASFINNGRYWSAHLAGDHTLRQSMAEFNFLLDYIPNWKRAYLPGGLIQFQAFVAADRASAVFRQMIETSHERRVPSYLGVLKRHRPDPFLLSHGLDGFSLALDFRVTQHRRERLVGLLQELEEIVLEGEGRFYFAKDSALSAAGAAEFLGSQTLGKLAKLKSRYDPQGLFSSNLTRRVFPELQARSGIQTSGRRARVT